MPMKSKELKCDTVFFYDKCQWNEPFIGWK